MPGSPVSPTPNSVPLLGASVSTLLEELTHTLQTGIKSAMDSLQYAQASHPQGLPPETLKSFLASILAAIQPPLQRELDTLVLFLARNVFSLPGHVSENAVRDALVKAKEAHDEVFEREIDQQLAAVRAEIRAKESEKRHLKATLERAKAQNELLDNIKQGKQAAAHDRPGDIGEVREVTEEAERECATAVKMMDEGGGIGLGKPRGNDDKLDERGPMQCYAAGKAVAGALDARAEELAVLRARLIG